MCAEAKPIVVNSILIVIPVLNEEKYLADCLNSILSQRTRWPHVIIVADGGSQDDTLLIASAFNKRYPNINIVRNEKKIQSAAVNMVAFSKFPGEVLFRIDAHSTYPSDFLDRCVEDLVEKQATTVVVPMRTVGKSLLQNVIAAVQNSVLGNGGAAHRREGVSRFVEHGHHAAFRRDVFCKLAGYREDFTHNEDAELDIRIIKSNGTIWLSSEATIEYFPRDDLRSLARQYRNHGLGRCKTLFTHRIFPKVRQILPVVMLLSFVGGLGLSMVDKLFIFIPIFWVMFYACISLFFYLNEKRSSFLLAGIVLAVIHFSWAFGFICGIFNACKQNLRRLLAFS